MPEFGQIWIKICYEANIAYSCIIISLFNLYTGEKVTGFKDIRYIITLSTFCLIARRQLAQILRRRSMLKTNSKFQNVLFWER